MSMFTDEARLEDNGRGNDSSSPGLSSPPSPRSPDNATTSTARYHHHNAIPPSRYDDGDGDGPGASLLEPKNAPLAKKPRKKREPKIKSESNHKTATANPTDGKEPVAKVRKPRGPTGSASSSTVGRKKKVVDVTESRFGQGQHLPRHTKILATAHPTPSSLPPVDGGVPANHPSPPQNGNNEAITRSIDPPCIMPSVPRSTSGQHYDPIRSATIEPRPRSPPVSHNASIRTGTPPRPSAPRYASASASPSIASLIEAPLPHHTNIYPAPPKHALDGRAPSPPTAKRPRLSPPAPVHALPPHPSNPDDHVPTAIVPSAPKVLAEVDPDAGSSRGPPGRSGALTKKPSGNASTGPSSTSHSPKPSRPREAPVPAGNGLLSSAVFGGTDDGMTLEKSVPTVILHVPLDGSSNMVVNFAELAEKQYGFHALHPRLAAQRERLARVAAAGAALENAHKGGRHAGSGKSADEMSVDLSENDGGADDSNVEMGGTGGLDRAGTGGSEGASKKKVPKKRMMKEDQYDKDDPFVDDTELAWEEQAAASRDGFFVYSGPLVPEGEKATVERADGVSKRGRGKGRGGGTRGTGKGGATTNGAPSTRAVPAVRKPRVTKAAKVQMEQEKLQRENMAVLAAKPTNYPG